MTLVLTLANRDQTIILADRRLTTSGGVVDEECAKCGAIVFRDARLAFGFTGIARSLGLEVRRWLLDALLHEAKPDYLAHQTLERLRIRATRDFSSLDAFARLSPEDRRFCVLFTGYLDLHDPPMIGSAILSNFVGPSRRDFLAIAQNEFVTLYEQEVRERPDNVSHIQRVGATGALSSKSTDDLRQALVSRKPAKAIVSIATEAMLRAAGDPAAGGTVGRQISWLRVPAQRTMSTETGYYSNVPTFQAFMPSFAILDGPESAMVMDTGWFGPMGENRQPVSVPKVGRNVPCPCRSGKKYKHCHGRQ